MDSLDFDGVIEKLPQIAKAVNEFKSEDLQRRAFDLLTSRLGVSMAEMPRTTPAPDTGANKPASNGKARKRASTAESRPSAKPKLVPDLNLRPKGEKSLREFVEEKKPKDNQERFAVIAYYLTETLRLSHFNRDHVFTAFRDLGVKIPAVIDTALQMTANRKGWLNTSNMNAITITIPGTNFVEHDLPHKPKK